MKTGSCQRLALLAGVNLALLLATTVGARAEDRGVLASLARRPDAASRETYTRIATIQIPGNPLTSFDGTFADPKLPLIYVADRSNASLDVIDSRTASVAAQIGGFTGTPLDATGAPQYGLSGPNGIASTGKGEVWVADGDSTVKVVDLFSGKIVATIPTTLPGHTAAEDGRADEMSYDARDHVLLVGNGDTTPPYVTIISTVRSDRHVLGQIVYNDAGGIGASVYDPATGQFLVSLPQVGPDPNSGAVSVVDPRRIAEVARFAVSGCGANGLALGPSQHLLLGCGLTNGSQILDARNGKVLANVTGVSGSDEVWFNPGDQKFYLGAIFNPPAKGGSSIGVIDAVTDTFVTNLATPSAAIGHSVAADSRNNRVFVPLSVTPNDTECTKGCVVVYAGRERTRPR